MSFYFIIIIFIIIIIIKVAFACCNQHILCDACGVFASEVIYLAPREIASTGGRHPHIPAVRAFHKLYSPIYARWDGNCVQIPAQH